MSKKKAVRTKKRARRKAVRTKILTPGPIGATLRQNLLTLANEFVSLTDTTLDRASRQISGDHRFFALLTENRCSFTVRKYDEIIEKFRASWPEGATMPALIDPTHSGSATLTRNSKKEAKHGTRSKKAA